MERSIDRQRPLDVSGKKSLTKAETAAEAEQAEGSTEGGTQAGHSERAASEDRQKKKAKTASKAQRQQSEPREQPAAPSGPSSHFFLKGALIHHPQPKRAAASHWLS